MTLLSIDPNRASGCALFLPPGTHPRIRVWAVDGCDARSIASLVALAVEAGATEAVIEAVQVHGSNKAGRVQLITMGRNLGRWVQSCEQAGLRVTLVEPRIWQAAVGAKALRGEERPAREARRVRLACAVLASEGIRVEPERLTVDCACAVLLGLWFEREAGRRFLSAACPPPSVRSARNPARRPRGRTGEGRIRGAGERE